MAELQQQQQRTAAEPAPSCGTPAPAPAAPPAAATPAPQRVPATLPEALATFAAHPSVLLILAALAGLAAWRAQYPAEPGADAAVALAVVAFWLVQEHVIHAQLLHSSFDWLGKRIHEGHHLKPYYHVSIDDPPIVLAFMLAASSLLWLGLGCAAGQPGLALTAQLAYYSMGLAYEWTHLVVHTRVVPRTKAGRAIRQHHMLHHTRSEAHWLAFIAPQVDAMFGTLPPSPGAVRMTPMAKAGLAAARAATSGGSSGAAASSL